MDEQISRLTAKLAEQGVTPELYLQRADLYRRHREYDNALRDIAEASEIKPDLSRIKLERAKVFNDSGRTSEAMEAAQEFLAVEADHPEGLIIRARCNLKLNQSSDAIRDFSTAIARYSAPSPDMFLERARAQVAMGDLESAVAGLDEGMKMLGNIPSLELPAIEFEQQRKNFSGALSRVDKIVARYPVKEPSLTMRGEVLEQAGRLAEARETFQAILTGIESYPPVRRGLDLTKQLESRVRSGLARVETKLLSHTNSPTVHPQSDLKQTP